MGKNNWGTGIDQKIPLYAACWQACNHLMNANESALKKLAHRWHRWDRFAQIFFAIDLYIVYVAIIKNQKIPKELILTCEYQEQISNTKKDHSDHQNHQDLPVRTDSSGRTFQALPHIRKAPEDLILQMRRPLFPRQCLTDYNPRLQPWVNNDTIIIRGL